MQTQNFMTYLSRPFSNITISSNDGGFASNHNISSTFESINQGFTASIQIVKLALDKYLRDMFKQQ